MEVNFRCFHFSHFVLELGLYIDPVEEREEEQQQQLAQGAQREHLRAGLNTAGIPSLPGMGWKKVFALHVCLLRSLDGIPICTSSLHHMPQVCGSLNFCEFQKWMLVHVCALHSYT